ncbi:MAG TPA: alginate lyase family protein [Blastocatellia bacterium]|nr:alginate lyase family protein [Blastocatellia bacterium]
MNKASAKLRRLQGKSLREIAYRSRQEGFKLYERLFGLGTGEISDCRFFGSIKRGQRDYAAADTAAYIHNRIRASVVTSGYCRPNYFFPSLGHRKEIARIMRRRFSDERDALIERAQRAGHGRFDLLGLSDVRFGDPIDWRLEPESGKRTGLDHWSKIDYLSPEVAGDKKITWELNRHQHFVTLGQAYWLTGNEWFAASFVAQATSWMDSNPPGRGINWASSLEVGFRSISWLWALHLFAGSPQLTTEFVLRLLKHLMAHGRHLELYLSRYFSPNTHLTGEALALFYIGTALPELKRAERWRALGLRILLEQLQVQVRADGVYFEQSSYYHRYTTDFYMHLVMLADASGSSLPVEVQWKLADMLDHLMWITRPDGSTPLIGDDDGGQLIKLGSRAADDFRDTLATGAGLFGRGDLKAVAGKAPAELLWLLGPEGLSRYDQIKTEASNQQSRAFKSSGFYVMRDGWAENSSSVVIDCGPHGALACGHSHADALSFEFAALGKTWLVDPGTFTYTGNSRERDHFRATEAHNTITVDGQSQSLPAGPFSWSRVACANMRGFIAGNGYDYFEGSHSGYERLDDAVSHQRAILFVKAGGDEGGVEEPSPYLVVRDTLVAQKRHRYAITYHLAPGCSAIADGNRVIVSEPGGRRLNIAVFGRLLPQASVIQGWVSRGYGRRETALVAHFEVDAAGPQEFATFIMPSAGKKTFRIDRSVESDHKTRFKISSGSLLDVVVLDAERNESESLAWARFVNNKMTHGCLICGGSLETDNISYTPTGPAFTRWGVR